MKQEKSREQLFVELAALQRDVEKNLAAQEQFIKRFQFLAHTEENPLSIINFFSCPVALFNKDGVLYSVNRTLMASTDLMERDIFEGHIRFLDRITNENFAMLDAVEGVFYGKTVLLSHLSHSLQLFCKSWNYPIHDHYHSALFFPLSRGEGCIRHGVIMLLK